MDVYPFYRQTRMGSPSLQVDREQILKEKMDVVF